MSIRILIADDHGIIRAGLRALLKDEPDLEIVGESAHCEATLRLACEVEPDVVLMDISMPGCGGIEATRKLTQRLPHMRVLILTMHEDKSLLQAAISAGASGYILKRAVESELLNAIQAIVRGDLYVDPSLTRALLETNGYLSKEPENPDASLTPREEEVLCLIAGGHTNRQIAGILNLSVRTVETHRANLMEKLGLRSRASLVRYAIEHDLFEPDGY